jgi:quinol monooxygenase YgiN
MITFITHVRVSVQNTAAFELLLSEIKIKVQEREPDVLYYDFAKSVKDPETYVVVEVYRDASAHAAHMETDWVKSSIPRSNMLIEGGKYDIRQYISPGTEPARERMSTVKPS